MAGRDSIVVGASAGGVEALRAMAAALPARLPAAVFVVLHIGPDAPPMLDRSGPLTATPATDGAPIEPGRIYVAPPDRHLLVRSGFVEVRGGPKEIGHRPATDVLFRSAAFTYGVEIDEGRLVRFRCRVGHGDAAESLVEEEHAALEAALRTALRALSRCLEWRDGFDDTARRFAERAESAEAKAEVVRQALQCA